MAEAPGDQPQVLVQLDCNRTINFAMQQNDVPVVRQIRITNGEPSPLEGLEVRLTSEPELFPAWQTAVSAIAPGGTYTLGPVDLRLSASLLMGLTERISGSIRVEVVRGEASLGQHAEPVEMLAFDEWNGLAYSLPELLAAYVLPNHPAVEEILSDAAKWLEANTGDSSVSGYQSRSPKRVGEIAQSVFKAIQARGIRYCNPPASFETTGQKIRLPDRILENQLATCLDLAVLAAACLEQAGLHPLVVMIHRHAFVGVWTIDDCFPDCATDDLLRLRKRVELDEILVFETTLVTAPPPNEFATAVAAGKRHLADEQAFQCAIDVHRCRKSRVRPLPSRRTVGEAVEATGPAHMDTSDTVFDLGSAAAPASEEQPETPATRLDRWKRKLLDLTLHNKLINFKETKSTVPLLCPTVGSLEDALADGLEFQVLPRPEEFGPNTARSAELHRLRTGADAVSQLLLSEFDSRRLRADLAEQELKSRLTGIYRSARTAMEEGGASALYLALGFLAWYETDSSEQRRLAPIILIPVEVQRHSVQEGYRICQADEEPRINITLLELLAQDFGLRLPNMDPIPEDEHGIDVKGILTTFRQAVKDMHRWDVVEEAYVGFFSFTKFLMWRDLEQRSEDLLKSQVVDHLVNHPNEPFPDDGGFPEEARLDEKYQPQDTFCPLPSDSSQLAAVYAAAEDKTFVLFGPPGTGKSQTITNLIAHSLAVGKSVLFVSEKMAALNVVYNRLSQCGLGSFCLELHSNKTHKRHVIEQLGEALDFGAGPGSEEWERQARQIAGLRADLNDYVHALHQSRNFGESVFQAASRLIGLRQARLLDLRLHSPDTVTREQLDHWYDLIERVQHAIGIAGHPDDNAWSTCGIEAWSAALQREVELDLRRLQQDCDQLTSHVQKLGPCLGIGTTWNLSNLDFAEKFVRFLVQAPRVPARLLQEMDWDSAEASIHDWLSHGRKRDFLRHALYQRYQERVLSLDLEALTSQLSQSQASWSLLRRSDSEIADHPDAIPGAATSAKTHLAELQRELEADLQCLQQHCDQLESCVQKLGPHLCLGTSWNLSYLGSAEKFVRLLSPGPQPSAPLLLEMDWESTESSISDWVSHGRKRDALRQTLYQRYQEQVLTLDLEGLANQLSEAQASWFLLRRTTSDMAGRLDDNPSSASGIEVWSATMQRDLEPDLLRLEEHCDRLESLVRMLGPRLGLGTNWNLSYFEFAEKFVQFLSTGPRPSAPLLLEPNWESTESSISDWVSHGRKRNALRQALYQRYEARLLGLDTRRLTQRLNKACASWPVTRWLGVRAVRKTLSQVLRSPEELDVGTMAQDLEQSNALREEEKWIADAGGRARQLLGQYWRDGEADWDVLDALRDWSGRFRKFALAITGANFEKAAAIRKHWTQLVTEGYEALQPEGELVQLIAEFLAVYEEFASIRTTIESKMASDSAIWGADARRVTLANIRTKLLDWLGVRAVRKTLAQVLRSPEQMNAAMMARDLSQAIALREEQRRLVDAGRQARQLLGRYWKDGEADWNAIEALRDWSGRFHKVALAITGSDSQKAADIRRRWAQLVTEQYEALQPEGELGQMIAGFLAVHAQFARTKASIEARLAGGDVLWGADPRRVTLAEIRAKLVDLLGVRSATASRRRYAARRIWTGPQWPRIWLRR